MDRIVLNADFRIGHNPGAFRLWWRALTGSDETLQNAYLMRMAPTRLRMIDDLLSRGLLDHCSREQVETLLGPRTAPIIFTTGTSFTIGPERGFMGIDSEWLVVRLDSVGKVREYRLARD